MKTRTTFIATAMAVILWLTLTDPLFSQGISKPHSLPGHQGTAMDWEQRAQLLEQWMDKLFSTKHQKENPANIYYLADTVNSYSYSDGDTKRLNTYDGKGNLITVLFKRRINDVWVDSMQNTFTYDGNSRILTYLSRLWMNGAWENANMETYTYDGSGNNTTYLAKVWENGAWLNTVMSTMTYDGNGNMFTSLSKMWDNGAWVNSFLTTYTYDTNNHMLSYLWQSWNGTGWENFLYMTFTYDASGNTIKSLGQMWAGGAWTNMYQTTATYDGNGHMLTRLDEKWAGTGWTNDEFTTLTWNGKSLMSDVVQKWTGQWTNYSKVINTYNGGGDRLTCTDLVWDGNVWQNFMKVEYEYFTGKIIGNGFMWSGSDWVTDEWDMVLSWINNGNGGTYFIGSAYYAEVYYSAYIVGIEATGKDIPSVVMVYPNPANERITIAANTNETGRASVRLFDITGRTVASFNLGLSHRGQVFTINTGDLKPGEYILELTTGNTTEKQKILITR
jgi:hypothetical protein